MHGKIAKEKVNKFAKASQHGQHCSRAAKAMPIKSICLFMKSVVKHPGMSIKVTEPKNGLPYFLEDTVVF